MSAESIELPEESTVLLCVDIGDGVEREIPLKRSEDPWEVAQVFCEEHNLPQRAVLALVEQIQSGLLQLENSDGTISSDQVKQPVEESTAYYRGLQDGLRMSFGVNSPKYRSGSNSPIKPKLPPRTFSASRFPSPLKNFTKPKQLEIFQSSTPYHSKVMMSQFSPTHNGLTPKSKTNALLTNMKMKKYKRLFSMLNPENGVINRRCIVSCNVTANIRSVISPILFEIAELDLRLNFKEFADRLDVLMKSLSQSEKNKILQNNKNKSISNDYSFRPSINKPRKPGKTIIIKKTKKSIKNKL